MNRFIAWPLALLCWSLVACGTTPSPTPPTTPSATGDASPLEAPRVAAREAPPTQQWDAATGTPTLPATPLCVYSGAFKGTWTGSSEGTFVHVVDARTGVVSGLGVGADGSTLTIRGAQQMGFHKTMAVSAGTTSDDTVFRGSMSDADMVSGTWSNGGYRGEFQGKRIGAQPDAIARITARFDGSDQGWIAIDSDDEGNLVGVLYSASRQNGSPVTGTWDGDTMRLSLPGDQVAVTVTGTASQGELKGSWQANAGQGTFLGSGCRIQ